MFLTEKIFLSRFSLKLGLSVGCYLRMGSEGLGWRGAVAARVCRRRRSVFAIDRASCWTFSSTSSLLYRSRLKKAQLTSSFCLLTDTCILVDRLSMV